MIVLDASVLIAHLARYDPHAERAYELLQTDAPFSVHPVTLAEVLVEPVRSGRAERVLRVIDDLGVETLDAPRDEPAHVAALRVATRLKLADCYVLRSAERLEAQLATFDAALASAARSRGVDIAG